MIIQKPALFFSLAVIATQTVNALFGHSSNEITDTTPSRLFASAQYLSVFQDDLEERSYELIDIHEDLVQDRYGANISLRKRGDDCQKYHKAVRGDNCYTLGLKYDVDMSNLYEWNEHINAKCTNLYPGKSYCVSKDQQISSSTCSKSHYVKSSDTCITVAKQYDLSLDQFYDMNPDVNRGPCNNLLTGGSYCVKLSNKIAQKVAQKTISIRSIQRKQRKRTSTKRKATTKIIAKKKSVSKKKFTSTKRRSTKTAVVKAAKKKSLTTKKKSVTTKKATSKKSTTTKHKIALKAAKKKTATTKKATTSTKWATTKKVTATKRIIRKATNKKTTTKKTTKKTTTKKTTTTIKKPTKTDKVVSATATKESDKRKLLQNNSALTYYWIAHPEDYGNNGRYVTVKTCDGKALGSVTSEYADALVMEGTGIVGNKIINLGGCTCHNYECFMEVDKKEDPYGLTSFGSPLRPFITIAANDIKRNTKIFVPDLEGWQIPGTDKRHNGCLLVDDQSWSFDDNHIDFYVYREKHYRTLNGEHKVNKVDIYEGGDCHLLNYA